MARIVVLEDDKVHRENLTAELTQTYGHEVRPFRDVRTLKEACDAALFEGDAPDVVILDIMLARVVSEGADFAPRCPGPGLPPADQAECYVDDELGLQVLRGIRIGTYDPGIPRAIPVLVLTARQNNRVRAVVQREENQPTAYLGKGVFTDEVAEKIQGLLAAASSA